MDSKQLAQIALQLIAGSSVKVDEQSLAAAGAVINMLKGIASGQYVLANAPPEPVLPKVKKK